MRNTEKKRKSWLEKDWLSERSPPKSREETSRSVSAAARCRGAGAEPAVTAVSLAVTVPGSRGMGSLRLACSRSAGAFAGGGSHTDGKDVRLLGNPGESGAFGLSQGGFGRARVFLPCL